MSHKKWLDSFEKRNASKSVPTLFDPLTAALNEWPASLVKEGWQLRYSKSWSKFQAYRQWYDDDGVYRDHSTALFEAVGGVINHIRKDIAI